MVSSNGEPSLLNERDLCNQADHCRSIFALIVITSVVNFSSTVEAVERKRKEKLHR